MKAVYELMAIFWYCTLAYLIVAVPIWLISYAWWKWTKIPAPTETAPPAGGEQK